MNSDHRNCTLILISGCVLATTASAYNEPPIAIIWPNPTFYPLAQFVAGEQGGAGGGFSYDPDNSIDGIWYGYNHGIGSYHWSFWPSPQWWDYSNWIHSGVVFKYSNVGKKTVYLEVEDDDWPIGTSELVSCDVWVFQMDLNVVNNVIGVGDTTQASLAYAPADLYAGYKELWVDTFGMGVIEVRNGGQTVIGGSDTKERWLLRSDDPSTVTVRAISPGQALLSLGYTPDGNLWPGGGLVYNDDRVTITVVEADVDLISGVADEVEEDPGGFIALNDDDDDGDGVIDYDDGYDKDGIPGNADDQNPSENDLVDVHFDLLPSWLEVGSVTLSQTGSDKVALWYGWDKLTLPITWDLSNPQQRADFWDFCLDSWQEYLYVEGIGASASARDAELKLSYAYGGTVVHEDIVKLTVVDVDLTASSLFGQVPEQDEDFPEGAFIHFNLDNDDSSSNSVEAPKRPGADYANDTTPVTGENDLELALPYMTPLLSEGLVVLSNTTFGDLWKSPTKGSGNLVLASGDSIGWHLNNAVERSQFWQLCTNPLYMEGASSTSGATVSLVYYSPTAAQVDADSVYYHFIAADCGDQPTTTGSPSERDWFEGEGGFPNLVRCEWSITAGLSPYYNCIAWSAGLSDRVVWRTIYEPGTGFVEEKWEAGVHYVSLDKKYGDRNDVFTMSDLDAFYATEAGVTPTASGPEDATIMYYSGYHGAKKRSCTCGSGKWIMFESKLGEGPRIEHVWDQLNCTGSPQTADYGTPSRFYK